MPVGAPRRLELDPAALARVSGPTARRTFKTSYPTASSSRIWFEASISSGDHRVRSELHIESDDTGIMMETAAAAKRRNQYHQLQLFLENRYPEHNVSNLMMNICFIE
eukprot:24352-Rhodomonas_salina.1